MTDELNFPGFVVHAYGELAVEGDYDLDLRAIEKIVADALYAAGARVEVPGAPPDAATGVELAPGIRFVGLHAEEFPPPGEDSAAVQLFRVL
jgi:hypothetical protein